MITVALSTTVNAPRERLWQSLVDARERPLWDERILGHVDLPRRRPRAPTDTDSISQSQWRFLFGGVPQVMKEKIVRAEGHQRLVTSISVGSLRFEQTITLHTFEDEEGEGDERNPGETGPHPRVSMKIIASNSIAVFGEVVPRLEVQKIVIEYVDTTLRQLRKFCES